MLNTGIYDERHDDASSMSHVTQSIVMPGPRACRTLLRRVHMYNVQLINQNKRTGSCCVADAMDFQRAADLRAPSGSLAPRKRAE